MIGEALATVVIAVTIGATSAVLVRPLLRRHGLERPPRSAVALPPSAGGLQPTLF